ncbi:MAG: acyl transferase [Bacteroidia bacterium]|nr:acyl transferase [Bacteroidia bacterium]MBT8277444.1 acyl transferase [Bacteroidia bacterium]NND24485.1 acyl transferase [Flavobacteriaceae bacterium]NNK60794.1 acyl transferase [Flavobacteriaceae bacterium]NNL32844.1 acyl transferase [Flavobacteriaceae bacterium]
MIDPSDIFKISNENDFETLALKVFQFQFENNAVYRSFCDLLYINPSDIFSSTDIPFLPIQFFKTHKVLSSKAPIQKIFESSGTTGSQTSKHYVTDLDLYRNAFMKGFEYNYGSVNNLVILALLPSYLERDNSSLVYMVDGLIKRSAQTEGGFFLDDFSTLIATLKQLESKGQKIVLIGVTFALLDLLEIENFDLNNCIIMETGGMKGKRKELVKEELHKQLKKGFGVDHIHSEYGMTELMSQAYSTSNNLFHTPPWMKVIARDTEDPFTHLNSGRTGGLDIIDLANINSCAFISTQDLGRIHPNGSFEVLGRFDHSDIRGCNLMVL